MSLISLYNSSAESVVVAAMNEEEKQERIYDEGGEHESVIAEKKEVEE